MTETQSLPATVDFTKAAGSTPVRVYRDATALTTPMTLDDACRWLQKRQGMSIDWAIRHEGYSFRELTPADEITHELQDTVDQLNVEHAKRAGRTQIWVLESRPISEPVDTAMTRGLFSTRYGAQASAAISEGIEPDAIDWTTVNDDQLYVDVDSTRWTLSAWPIDKFDGTE